MMKLIVSAIIYAFIAITCYAQVDDKFRRCETVKCARPQKCPDNYSLFESDPANGICCAYCAPDPAFCRKICANVMCLAVICDELSVKQSVDECNCCPCHPPLNCGKIKCQPKEEIAEYCRKNGQNFHPADGLINCCGQCCDPKTCDNISDCGRPEEIEKGCIEQGLSFLKPDPKNCICCGRCIKK